MINISGTTIEMTRGDSLIVNEEILDDQGQTDLTQVFDGGTNYYMEV